MALAEWDPQAEPRVEIQFSPARVVMQDFTGVPCVVDLATMREAMQELGGDPGAINPLIPAELVIDHSVIAERFGTRDAFERNVEIEYGRNEERYRFLRWGQRAFSDFKVVPPGTGIVHQVNIEYLARVIFSRTMDSRTMLYPDTVVGTDSHTTMVNGLGVLGWGVGGIEAEAAILGQPVSMLIPRVVGFRLFGSIPTGVTATDVVLTITDKLRKHGVVGKFVEFYGSGVGQVPLANRATIGNMSPEFGCTAAIFPIDQETVDYLKFTGRSQQQIDIIKQYCKAQHLWHDPLLTPRYSEHLELNLADIKPSIAGPSRPQDRIELASSKEKFRQAILQFAPASPKMQEEQNEKDSANQQVAELQMPSNPIDVTTKTARFTLDHGHIGIAAITSCTNTSNPQVMMAAGLLAKKAIEYGLRRKPWVKTTLAPGSKVVTDYYKKSGLLPYLEELGFYLVGYGCTTCIGNSGPLEPEISAAIAKNDLVIASVLSGNRNFEGRINPDIKMNYLASPPLVVAYSIAGTMDFDFALQPLGTAPDGKSIYLKDIWPSTQEIAQLISQHITTDMYTHEYASVFEGDEKWRNIEIPTGSIFTWSDDSTYVRKAPYFDGMSPSPAPVADIRDARVLALLGDSVTTDHISPAGAIKADSPAGVYLSACGIQRQDFNSYGSRRGNHEVMIRGTFANIRLKNLLLKDAEGKIREGGYTKDFTQDSVPQSSIYDASRNYIQNKIPLVILAGKEYGSGSSRDWAAKGTLLLGVRAVIAESFERIHRSNLVGMGVAPLEFPKGQSAQSLGLDGTESFTITGLMQLNDGTTPKTVQVTAAPTKHSAPGKSIVKFDAILRIDTPGEADYYRHGGILQFVLRSLAAKST